MDKKSTLIGVLLLGAAFAMMFWQGKQYQDVEVERQKILAQEAVQKEEALGEEGIFTKASAKHTKTEGGIFESVREVEMAEKAQDHEKLYVLENEYVTVRFTTRGGGIKDVALKKYPIVLGSEYPYIFNQNAQQAALGLSFATDGGKIKEYVPEFRLVSQSTDKILFSAETAEGVKILRGYNIKDDETDKNRNPYVINHETRFVNNSREAFNLKKLLVNMGSYPATTSDSFGEYLNVGYYDGKNEDYVKIGVFHGSKGFLGFGAKEPVDRVELAVKHLVWASVKNQFFASVLTPKEPGSGVYVVTEELKTDLGEEEGMKGSMEFELGQINPGQERIMDMQFYVGPKEYERLEALGQNQDLLMQFGFLGMISKFLLIVMTGIHNFIPNWGLTIIIVTIIIKLVLWPLTSIQVRSSKRMAKIQKPLQELKEKYKNNPQKIQLETMKLFKEHRVNPAAGCLPLFVQLPIFLGLYFMLRSSSELRFAPFLWIPDLSVPDTIAYIGGFPINILPLLMGVSMFYQMKLTPAPMTDNMQRKMFQLMPFIFLIFCYNFPSGLVLYWTVQNLLTIVQQYITNKMKDPMEDVILAQETSAKGKKSSKNLKIKEHNKK